MMAFCCENDDEGGRFGDTTKLRFKKLRQPRGIFCMPDAQLALDRLISLLIQSLIVGSTQFAIDAFTLQPFYY